MTDYAAVLEALYPGAEWSLNGGTYDGLVWHSEGKKPTKKTLDDAWPQVQYERQVEAVRQARQARYTAETDPMFFQIQRGEGDATVDDWTAAVNRIRADLPMPKETDRELD